jgi:hypothetical protein
MTSQELHAKLRALCDDPSNALYVSELWDRDLEPEERRIKLDGEFTLEMLRAIAMHMKNPDKQEY